MNQKMYRVIFSALLVLLMSTATVFALPTQEVQTLEQTRVVTDMRGRSVTIPRDVETLIAVDAGALRLVSYVDATDKIIAVEDAGHGREKSDYPFFYLATYRIAHPELRDLPSIGGADNHEGIIAANPDLVISSAVDVAKLDQLQNILGIPVFGVDVDVEFYDIDRFYDQLQRLGVVLGKESRASDLIDGIKASLADLQGRAAMVTNAKKAYAGGMMYYGEADLFRTTGDFLPFDLTSSQNVMPTNPTGNMQPYMTGLEDLIAAEPSYIFLDAANLALSEKGYNENKRVLDELVPAFRNKDVYSTFVYKYYGTNWENQLINVHYVGKVLYPELFSDISIEAKAQEIWKLFFNVDLDYENVCTLQKSTPKQVTWFN